MLSAEVGLPLVSSIGLVGVVGCSALTRLSSFSLMVSLSQVYVPFDHGDGFFTVKSIGLLSVVSFLIRSLKTPSLAFAILSTALTPTGDSVNFTSVTFTPLSSSITRREIS